MKRLVFLALAVTALIGLGSCALFKSKEAAILTFVLDGLVGSATIDADARTVTATVEPMDLSAVTPEVTVSEKADLTQNPALADGEAVTYVVTAENGDTAEWSVTVTVQYGISFSIDGAHVVLTSGLVNNTDATSNEELGNGVPFAINVALADPSYLWVAALKDNYDVADPPADAAMARLVVGWVSGDPGAGTFDETVAQFIYQRAATEADPAYQASAGSSYAGTTLDAEIASLGEVGGDILGTFSASASDSDEATPAVTVGFFKVKRLADDTTI